MGRVQGKLEMGGRWPNKISHWVAQINRGFLVMLERVSGSIMGSHGVIAPWAVSLLCLVVLISISSRMRIAPVIPNDESPTKKGRNLETTDTTNSGILWNSSPEREEEAKQKAPENSLYLEQLWRTPNQQNAVELRSALGDPGMISDKVRVAVEGWNFCNRAGDLKDSDLSPRWADCADLLPISEPSGVKEGSATASWEVSYKISDVDNALKTGDDFPESSSETCYSVNDPDLYAVEKEKYLASLCAVEDEHPWYFWMIMLKNGNFNQTSDLCNKAESSSSSSGFGETAEQNDQSHDAVFQPIRQLLEKGNGFPCFGPGCMNQPFVVHEWSHLEIRSEVQPEFGIQTRSCASLTGSFYGTYDLDEGGKYKSFFSVRWYKNETKSSWIFHHQLKVSDKYPWLMLYLRADATKGFSGGYPWETRGMMHTVPESPNFKVILTLNVIRGGGPQSQFYLLDIGGCWKNNGQHCDGDLTSDVTRYSEMIINPATPAWCQPERLEVCPPYHSTLDGVRIHRNDTQNFPYTAYHMYCVPFNAEFAEKPFRVCDPYSNPQPQEIMQLLPHPEWAHHGYPAQKGDGWIGDSRKWELDAGALSSRLYFYQDPGTPPATRRWPSIDIGTEIYISDTSDTAEWTLSDFDVLIPS